MKSTRSTALRLLRLLALAWALCMVQALRAQSPVIAPSAVDENLRQQQRERLLREQQERTPDVHLKAGEPAAPLALPAREAPCVQVHRLQLKGDAAEQFQWALSAADRLPAGGLDRATPRCLGSGGMNIVMRRIQDAIAASGYPAARVLAGVDALAEPGTLRLTLWPGRIGKIRFAPGTSARARAGNALAMHEGDVLYLPDLEQSLENFQRVPTVQAGIDLLPAEAPGAPGRSDLLIHWQQARLLRGMLGLDDSGTRATGKYLGSATLSCDHCLQLNDLFYLSGTRALGGGDEGERGTHSTVAHYSLPFGYWQLAGTVSQSRFWQSVAGLNGPIEYSGETGQGELRLGRLLHRGRLGKTSLALRIWARSARNFIEDTEVQAQRSRMAGWGATLLHRQFIAAATLDLGLDYRRGTGAVHAIDPPEAARGEGTARMQILSADAQLALPFKLGSQALRYAATLRAQFNGTPLVPLDRFAIGSRYTVRGFDGEQQLVAERGFFLRNDLALALGSTAQELYLGLDVSAVGGPSSDLLLGKHLAGAVLGWRAQAAGVNLDWFCGAPISRPHGFGQDGPVFGFNLNWVF